MKLCSTSCAVPGLVVRPAALGRRPAAQSARNARACFIAAGSGPSSPRAKGRTRRRTSRPRRWRARLPPRDGPHTVARPARRRRGEVGRVRHQGSCLWVGCGSAVGRVCGSGRVVGQPVAKKSRIVSVAFRALLVGPNLLGRGDRRTRPGVTGVLDDQELDGGLPAVAGRVGGIGGVGGLGGRLLQAPDGPVVALLLLRDRLARAARRRERLRAVPGRQAREDRLLGVRRRRGPASARGVRGRRRRRRP